jgi:heme/copper-type cytochrome/quinol oxidase subunit 4
MKILTLTSKIYIVTSVFSVFQAMGFSIFGGYPLIPVVLLQIIFSLSIALYCFSYKIVAFPRAARTINFWLKAFIFYSVISGLTLPFLFAGTDVFSPRLGIDEQVARQTPLEFSTSNIAQILYLLFNAIYFMGGLIVASEYKKLKALNLFVYAGYIILFFSIYQKINHSFEIWFPYLIINSNELYVLGGGEFVSQIINGSQRLSATFTEASYAGNVLGTYFVYYLLLIYYGGVNVSRVLTAAAFLCCTLFTVSSIGYIQVIFGLFYIIYNSIKNKKNFSIVASAFVAAVAMAFIFDIEVFLETTVNKSDSLSFFNRIYSDEFSLGILVDTYYMGVGLGGNRPSSFLTYMFSNVGVIGSLLFGIFLFKIYKLYQTRFSELSAQKRAIFLSLVSHIIGKVVGLPDLNFWFFWMLLSVVAILLVENRNFNN